jgi:ribonuclease HI
VEAYAAGIMALKTCRAMRYEKVQFEGDAKVVVDAVNSGEIDRRRIGHLRAESWKMRYKYAWVVLPDCIRDILLSHDQQFALSPNF